MITKLGNYITANVRQQSIVVNRKSRTPTVTPSANMGDKRRGMKKYKSDFIRFLPVTMPDIVINHIFVAGIYYVIY